MCKLMLLVSIGMWSASLFAESAVFAEASASFGVAAQQQSRAAGVSWTAPDGWKIEGPRPMRAATYTITPVPGDQGLAECVVNYFGPGQGGSVEANIERWKSQVQGPDGKPAAAKVAERKLRGLTITTIDASGGYSGMGGPIATSPKIVPGYRLFGAIVQAPGGTVFFKLTGPAKTVAGNQAKFEQLIASLQLDK